MAAAPTGLTRRGWSLLGAALGLLAAGRLLGTTELVTLGLGAGALLLVAALWTRSRPVPIRIQRRIRPVRVHVGGDARVDLEVTASGPTPRLLITDSFDDGHRAARFLAASLRTGEQTRAAYRIPTDSRGRFRIGPMTVGVADPFGLSSRNQTVGGVTEVVVRPRVHELRATPLAPGRRRVRHHDRSRLPIPAPVPDEFLSLRDYEVGDDLRRVHWRSSARLGDLLVRDDEAAWPPHATVLLDNRRGSYDAPGYEAAIEAVASIAIRLRASGRACAVLTTIGSPLGAWHGDDSGTDRLLDELAVLQPDADHPLAIRRLTSLVGSGLLVVVTGAPADRPGFDQLAGPGTTLVLVVCADEQPPSHDGRPVVDGRPSRFATTWDRALAPRRRRRRSA